MLINAQDTFNTVSMLALNEVSACNRLKSITLMLFKQNILSKEFAFFIIVHRGGLMLPWPRNCVHYTVLSVAEFREQVDC